MIHQANKAVMTAWLHDHMTEESEVFTQHEEHRNELLHIQSFPYSFEDLMFLPWVLNY